jgi:hypothetical protein
VRHELENRGPCVGGLLVAVVEIFTVLETSGETQDMKGGSDLWVDETLAFSEILAFEIVG